MKRFIIGCTTGILLVVASFLFIMRDFNPLLLPVDADAPSGQDRWFVVRRDARNRQRWHPAGHPDLLVHFEASPRQRTP